MTRRTHVFGPAYLDRVLRVDRALADPPLDQSVDGHWKFAAGLTLVDPAGCSIVIDLPPGWPGPSGEVGLSHALTPGQEVWRREARGLSWHDDLGGMGAGFAAALHGTLVSALGAEDDPTSLAIAERLRRAGVAHRPIRVPGRPADWTLLVTSGEFGDKLPIGFRGCHAALESVAPDDLGLCDLRVVASLPNRLAAEALSAPGACVRLFAPAMRNMTDRECPVSRFAHAIDVLCCNRREWESLDDREEVAWRVSVLAVTDGARGSSVRFTTPNGEAGSLTLPAFPRSHPPRDTNRAGEAYASTLIATLLDHGWTPGVSDESLVRLAAERASAAAALVLDRAEFGFPGPEQINEALREGRV
jgi:ribokinase